MGKERLVYNVPPSFFEEELERRRKIRKQALRTISAYHEKRRALDAGSPEAVYYLERIVLLMDFVKRMRRSIARIESKMV